MQKPPKIQVLVETSPMEADWFAPRCPTIDASMYCIITVENCASIAGRLNVKVRESCSANESRSPFLILASSMSLDCRANVSLLDLPDL